MGSVRGKKKKKKVKSCLFNAYKNENVKMTYSFLEVYVLDYIYTSI